jgi:hypothetical protein
LLYGAAKEHAMAKRPMRRMTAMNEDSQGRPRRPSTPSSLTDTARDMSFNAVRVAAETARAALSGMQELGRAMADIAAPAARRSAKTANDVARAAMDATRQIARSVSSPVSDATGSPAKATDSPAKAGSKRSSGRKSRRRRAA